MTNETFGELMNHARRYERLGNLEKAAECAQKALHIHAQFPNLFGHINQRTLDKAAELASKAVAA